MSDNKQLELRGHLELFSQGRRVMNLCNFHIALRALQVYKIINN